MSSKLQSNLEHSNLYEAKNVSTLLQNGATFDEENNTGATSTALLETYQSRLEHLSSLDSFHAKRLLRSTQEFCNNLENLNDQPITFTQIDDPVLGSYIIWYKSSDETPVGCTYVIGRSEVSEEIWESVWHDN